MIDFDAIEGLIARGQIIAAIKELRAATGLGLKDTKEAVDAYRDAGRWPASLNPPPRDEAAQEAERLGRWAALRAEIEPMCQPGRKIAAIKRLREVTGLGLKDAKEAVDAFIARGQWPPGMWGEPVLPDPVVVAALNQRRRDTEGYCANGRKIAAIKLVREVSGLGLADAKRVVEDFMERGRWPSGLWPDAHNDAHNAHNAAPAPQPPTQQSLGLQTPPAATPKPTPAPPAQPPRPATPKPTPAPPAQTPPPTHAPAAPTPTPAAPAPPRDFGAAAPAVRAVIESLGRDPNVALAVPAQKLFRDGFLVCGEHDAHFAYEQFGSWAVEPPIDYADVTEVEARAGMLGAELRVRVGYLSVRFSDISDADADAVARLIAARAGC